MVFANNFHDVTRLYNYLISWFSIFYSRVKLFILLVIYLNRDFFYVEVAISMTNIEQQSPTIRPSSINWYLFGLRPLTHVVFWLTYYVVFSLVWVKPELGYFASFYLEFVLLPVRILAVYSMIYWLIPQFLMTQQYRKFIVSYLLLLLVASSLQRLSDHFFYQQLLLGQQGSLLDFSGWLRSIILINSTVIFLAAIKVFQLYLLKQQELIELRRTLEALESEGVDSTIELKANRRTHHIKVSQILYVEGMGNYVSYHLKRC